jgi:fluoride exporter
VSAAVLLGVGLAGGVGALARFLVDGAVAQRAGTGFPFGTLAVNLSGAFALGMVVGAALDSDAYRLVGTGVIGAYTTFSTWAFESQRLGEDGQLRLGGLNFVVSLVLGVLVAWAGRDVGRAL